MSNGQARAVRLDAREDRGVVLDDIVDREHAEAEPVVLEAVGNVEVVRNESGQQFESRRAA